MEPTEDPLCSLRWEIALDVRDHEDQHTQQYHDLDHIIEEKLDTAADPACWIKAYRFHNAAHQAIQPLHSKNFFLEEIPCDL